MKSVCTVWLTACLLVTTSLFAQPTPDLHSTVETMLQHLCTPDEEGFAVLPTDTRLLGVLAENETLRIQLDIPLIFLRQQLDEQLHEEIIEHFASPVYTFGFSVVTIEAADDKGIFRPLSFFLPTYSYEPLSLAYNDDPAPAQHGNYNPKGIQLLNKAQPEGLLSEKTIWLSAGHGWQYDQRRKCFKTQRTNSFGLVEDFTTAESVNYYLLRYLRQAGANVWTVRERDMNPFEVIVDNDQGAPAYKESGNWATSKTNGYQGRSYRYAITQKNATAAAHFTPDIPEDGQYWVSVHYVGSANRTVDARYRIIHAGGESMVSLNQEVHGDTWVYLGQFYFEKGRNGKVVLLNESTEGGQAVIADAVRFGGGLGTTPDCDSGRKSGEPRFEEAARYFAPFQGFPQCMNDVMVRPLYAEWELAKGTSQEQKNAIYVSWHTNASDTRGSGSESYIHSSKAIKGSSTLRDYIHREVLGDIRNNWDPAWVDRGAKSADFGELRGLKTMPGVLLEIGFHDHEGNAEALSTPAFRNLVARSVYKGIVRYFSAKDHRVPVFLPEPPSHLSAINSNERTIQLRWHAPASGGALGSPTNAYKVYISEHPKAFADFVNCAQTSFTFSDLKPATTYYFKVAAVNPGGESFSSAVVAVRTPDASGGQPKYLIVDGFDRLDKALAPKVKETLPGYAPLGVTRRLFLEQMNNYDYAGEHAKALTMAGVCFDGADNEAVAAGQVLLYDYDGVDWFLGRESTSDEPLSGSEMDLLSKYLNQGGNLIISGSELAYALDNQGQGKSFFQNYLKAGYLGDDAGVTNFQGQSNSVFKNEKGSFQRMTYGAYRPDSPDFITPLHGGEAVLQYANGKIAAVAYNGNYGLLNCAFPLESVASDQLRGALMQDAVAYFGAGKKEKSLILVELPEVFGPELRLDLHRAPEGRAEFQLINQEGEEVLSQNWSHSGSGDRTISTQRLPPARYQYRFEMLGVEQRGFVVKE